MVCATVGVPFRGYMSKTVSGERVLMIRRLGGEVVLTPASEGMAGALAALLEAGTESELFAAQQFENPRNVFAHRHSTGPQLIQQVGVRLHGFVAGVGTGGTLMGVAHALRDHGHDTVVAQATPTVINSEGDPEVSGGIPGVVDGMSQLLDPGAVGLADPVLVPESEAVATASSPVAAWASDRRAASTSPPHDGSRRCWARDTTSPRFFPTAWSGTSRPRSSTTWPLSSSTVSATGGGVVSPPRRGVRCRALAPA